MRPTEPGFTAKQASSFRKAFRAWCDFYSSTNEDIGKALDVHENLRGRWSEGAGPKAVANAMLKTRKLTHTTARRLLVGLFLSEPARRSESPSRSNQERSFRFKNEHSGFCELVGLLIKFGALPLTRLPALRAFIPPVEINRLANDLSAEAVAHVPGISAKMQATLARVLRRYLNLNAPAMASAWCEDVERTSLVRIAGAEILIAVLARAAFGKAYVYPSQAPWWGPEFDLLSRERPKLRTEVLLIPSEMRSLS